MNTAQFGLAEIGRGLINTSRSPDVYSEEMKRAVFAKATPHPLRDFAYDENGKLILFSEYGDRDSLFGWEYDHWPVPKSQGGTDELSNLRPLNCFDNASNRHGRALARGLINSRT